MDQAGEGVQNVRMNDRMRIVMDGLTIGEYRDRGGLMKQVDVSFSLQDTSRKMEEVGRFTETLRLPAAGVDLNAAAEQAAGSLSRQLRNLADTLAPADS